jgi:serine/threonine protein kinase
MSTIQNIKNFIRHGKQARLVTPHSEPTTDVSTINAEPQRQPPGQYTPALEAFGPEGRANAIHKPDSQVRHDRSVEIERLVAEENMNRSKMPKYPGLERWILVEKMGDGAFSNVYRAKDTTTEYGEVAIKVVRKFEMNSNQVGYTARFPFLFFSLCRFVSSFLDRYLLLRLVNETWPIPFVERSSVSNGQKCPKGGGGAHTILS